jgi:organic hydroperoxide reductase OsmC/OhrA
MGKIENVDGTLTVTEITLKPTITIPTSQKKSKAKEVLEMSQKACALANSITTHITLEPIIVVQ